MNFNDFAYGVACMVFGFIFSVVWFVLSGFIYFAFNGLIGSAIAGCCLVVGFWAIHVNEEEKKVSGK